MHYVCLLRSQSHPAQRYVGLTSDLKSRLGKHNGGEVPHTSKFLPWKLEACIALPDRQHAVEFERYLKSGSGRAFANRHLWPAVAR